MSETFREARDSINRLKTALREADEDTLFMFFLWVVWLATMSVAIVAQFGAWGALFCFGLVIWKSAAGQAR